MFANIDDLEETSAIGTSSAFPDEPMVPVCVCGNASLLSLPAANTLSNVAAEGLLGRGILDGPITAVPDLKPKAVDSSAWGWGVASVASPTDGSFTCISVRGDEGRIGKGNS